MVAQIPLGYRNRLDVKGPVVTGGSTGNYGAAASVVDIGEAYKTLASTRDYDGTIANEMVNNANEFATKVAAEGGILRQTAISDAEIAVSEYNKKRSAEVARADAGSKTAAAGIGAVAQLATSALPLFMSDERTKNTIQAIENATQKLRHLKPVSFHYKEEYSSSPERKHHGFIAQQYKDEMPDATYYDESTGMLCIDTVDLIGVLVRAFQELDTRITRMEAQRALTGVK